MVTTLWRPLPPRRAPASFAGFGADLGAREAASVGARVVGELGTGERGGAVGRLGDVVLVEPVAAGFGARGLGVGGVGVPVGDEAGVVEEEGVEGAVGRDAGEGAFGVSMILRFVPKGGPGCLLGARN